MYISINYFCRFPFLVADVLLVHYFPSSVCNILNLENWFFPCIFSAAFSTVLTSEFEDKRELPSPSPYMHHCLYQQSGYWRRLLQPVVTAKALFNMRLSGFHFEDTWKSSMLTRHAYPRQARVKTFCTWGEGRDFSKVQCAREIKNWLAKLLKNHTLWDRTYLCPPPRGQQTETLSTPECQH